LQAAIIPRISGGIHRNWEENLQLDGLVCAARDLLVFIHHSFAHGRPRVQNPMLAYCKVADIQWAAGDLFFVLSGF